MKRAVPVIFFHLDMARPPVSPLRPVAAGSPPFLGFSVTAEAGTAASGGGGRTDQRQYYGLDLYIYVRSHTMKTHL